MGMNNEAAPKRKVAEEDVAPRDNWARSGYAIELLAFVLPKIAFQTAGWFRGWHNLAPQLTGLLPFAGSPSSDAGVEKCEAIMVIARLRALLTIALLNLRQSNLAQ